MGRRTDDFGWVNIPGWPQKKGRTFGPPGIRETPLGSGERLLLPVPRRDQEVILRPFGVPQDRHGRLQVPFIEPGNLHQDLQGAGFILGKKISDLLKFGHLHRFLFLRHLRRLFLLRLFAHGFLSLRLDLIFSACHSYAR